MVRPAIIPQWETVAYEMLAAQPNLSARKLAEALIPIAREANAEAPSERTVGRIKASWEGLPEDRRRQYALVHWPGSMGSPLLPWEASEAVLELLGASENRPNAGLAHWYWRAKQAAAGAAVEDLIEVAHTLLSWQLLGRQAPLDDLESWLAFRPWDSDVAEARYKDAINEGRCSRLVIGGRGFRGWDRHTGHFDPSKGDLRAALSAMTPGLTDWALDSILEVMRGDLEARS